MMDQPARRLTAIAAQSLLGGVVALAASAPVAAKTYANVTVSAGARIASNPFLEQTGAPSGQAVTLEISPFVRMEGASSSLTFQSNVRLDQYVETYGSDLAGDVGVDFEKRFSAQTSVRAGAGFRSSRSTLRDILGARSNPSAPVIDTPALSILPDPTLIGRNRRNNTWDASIGLTTRPTSRDVVSVDFSINQLTTSGQSAQDYRYATLQTSLSHRLSGRTSLQLSVGVGDSKYLNQRAGNGRTITPMAGITTRLNSSFTLTALAGTTFSKIDRGDGTKVSKTSWAAQLNLCRRTDRDGLCLTGARNTQPTSFGGVRAVTSVGLDYNRRLSEKDTIGAAVSFSQSGGGVLPGGVQDPLNASTRYIMASTTLSHRFTKRFVGYITPGLDHVKNSTLSPRLEYQLNFGVRYIFGEVR